MLDHVRATLRTDVGIKQKQVKGEVRRGVKYFAQAPSWTGGRLHCAALKSKAMQSSSTKGFLTLNHPQYASQRIPRLVSHTKSITSNIYVVKLLLDTSKVEVEISGRRYLLLANNLV